MGNENPAPKTHTPGAADADLKARLRMQNRLGYAAALEDAAKLIEGHVIMDTSAGKVLAPRRQDGNRDGLAYADAIRALATAAEDGR